MPIVKMRTVPCVVLFLLLADALHTTTGLSATVISLPVEHGVSKNIHDIIDCNLKTDYQMVTSKTFAQG